MTSQGAAEAAELPKQPPAGQNSTQSSKNDDFSEPETVIFVQDNEVVDLTNKSSQTSAVIIGRSMLQKTSHTGSNKSLHNSKDGIATQL